MGIKNIISSVTGLNKATNFNKIIDVTITSSSGEEIKIICPKSGRKPNIEVTGTLFTDNNIPQFNIIIKNFYIAPSQDKEYSKVTVWMGYADGKHIAFTGSIFFMYQDSPGPESSTVIQCMSGSLTPWLTSNINASLAAGYTLEQVVTLINNKLGYKKTPYFKKDIKNKTSAEPLEYNENINGLIAKIRERFSVILITINDQLVVYPVGEAHGLVRHEIKFLSAPPVFQGGGDTQSYAQITAPYNPDIKPGDEVTVYSSVYKTRTGLTNVSSKTTIAVANVQFHFSTVGTVNQMVIEGPPIGDNA